MLDLGSIFLGANLVTYAIAVVMPTWRWLLALTLVVAVVSYTGWLRHWIALLLPIANEGPGGGLASALALGMIVTFATGVVVRGLTILLGLRRGYVVVICVAGVALSPAIFVYAPELITRSSQLLRWGSSTATCQPDRLQRSSSAECYGRH
ncbi:hypothetical protein [Bradyrhizobium sp.]|uniref:hypothetical protein n=1 Tax=Bradyrhizobium sp. TaxID=376 RepID=UPI0025C1630C|nr:hypothetical protein [Bradyrhizobium sp.]MBV8917897.1 hypothetical protein [Bradyrhizobium sp.]